MTHWIVCIARNALPLTKAAIASFLKQDIPVQVLVIDNGSTDGTTEWLHSQPVYTIHYRQAKSVAECWNRAIRLCMVEDDHVLVCNNDVELRPDTYRLLLENGGPFVTAIEVFDKKQMDTVDVTRQGPHPDFSCFLIRKECWQKFSAQPERGFDMEMKIAYVEDCDAHVRLHRLGIPAISIYVPFYHARSSTVKHSDEGEAQRIREQADRNRERFYQKYGVRVGTPEYSTLFTDETFGSALTSIS